MHPRTLFARGYLLLAALLVASAINVPTAAAGGDDAKSERAKELAARGFDAYDEAFPLTPGWRDRVALYQLYPLLVHVCLFGGGYVGQLRRAVAGLV